MAKKILWVIIILLVVIQFIHPARNKNNPQPNNIETKYNMPADVKTILQKACYDCHSNNTRYPWYSKLQPVDWWLTHHVNEGKRELNFDEFTNRPIAYQYHKLDETDEQVRENKMPLNSYTWIHKDAILTDAEKQSLSNWISAVRSNMEAIYPKDSLVRKRPRPEKE